MMVVQESESAFSSSPVVHMAHSLPLSVDPLNIFLRPDVVSVRTRVASNSNAGVAERRLDLCMFLAVATQCSNINACVKARIIILAEYVQYVKPTDGKLNSRQYRTILRRRRFKRARAKQRL